MKKIQLIEIGILAVILICGYHFISTLVSFSIAVLYEFFSDYRTGLFPIVQYIIVAGIYLGTFIILVKKKTAIATYISQQTQPALLDDEANTIQLKIYQHNLIYIVLIALCLITLLSQVSEIVVGAYEYFKKESGGIRDPSSYINKQTDFTTAVIKAALAAVILYFAKPISEWFGKDGDTDNKIIETTNQS